MEELTEFVRKTMVRISWGDFDGMREPSLTELLALRALVDRAINQLEAAEKE